MGRRAEGLSSRVAELLAEIEDHDDPRVAYALLQSHLRQARSEGLGVPDELIRLERQLKTDCMAQSQGR